MRVELNVLILIEFSSRKKKEDERIKIKKRYKKSLKMLARIFLNLAQCKEIFFNFYDCQKLIKDIAIIG